MFNVIERIINMGRLTEILDIVHNGIQEPESYSHLDVKDDKTRDILIELRKQSKKCENLLF